MSRPTRKNRSTPKAPVVVLSASLVGTWLLLYASLALAGTSPWQVASLAPVIGVLVALVGVHAWLLAYLGHILHSRGISATRVPRRLRRAWHGLTGVLCGAILVSASVTTGLTAARWHATRQTRAAEEVLLQQARARIPAIRQGNVTIDFGASLAGQTVLVRHRSHAFRFGCNAYQFERYADPALNARYRAAFSALFNYGTVPFYWQNHEPRRGEYPNDPWLHDMAAWLIAANATPKGHPLVWQNGSWVNYPAWVTTAPENISSLLLARVEHVLQAFPEIATWDLLNEMVHIDNGLFGPTPADTWTALVQRARAVRPEGEYIANDFATVGPGDPGALNDQCTPSTPATASPRSAATPAARRFYQFVTDTVAAGHPPDALGFQFHATAHWQPLRDILDTFDAFGRFHLPCHVTEFIPASRGMHDGGTRVGPITEATQAEWAVRAYTTLFSHPAVEAITWWDFGGGAAWGAWKERLGGYLMDGTGRLLPVYDALHALIHEEWNSTRPVTLDGAGRADFWGFYGTYEVLAGDDPVLVFAIVDDRPASARAWSVEAVTV